MLFYLDNPPDDFSYIPPDVLASVASELARARRDGHHLIVINRPAVSWLLQNVDLSRRDAAILSRVAQEFAQTGNVRRQAMVYVKLTCNAAENLTIEGNAIRVSFHFLARHDLLSRPILVIENQQNDGAFYEFLLHNHSDFFAC